MKIHDWKMRTTAGVAVLALLLGGCSATTDQTSATSSATAGSGLGLVGLETHAKGDEGDYDAGTAVTVSLADGATTASSDAVTVTSQGGSDLVTITAAGTYLLSGTLGDGQVLVDVGGSEDVQVVLDGADITSSKGPALQVVDADEVTVVLAEGSTNALADPADYAQTEPTIDEDGEEVDVPNAALYSTADLTIAGPGALTVTGAHNDGIASKDGLVILDGQITVTAVDDGIRGKDYLAVQGGTISVEATGDGLKSDNSDEGTGILLVAGSGTSITVASGDDAVKGENVVDVVDGTLTVTASVEGIESARVIIEAGTIDVTSSDDGINASSDVTTPSLEIHGGTITVTSQGDALDSNGDLTMTGGTVVAHGATSRGDGALDADGAFLVSGGTLVGLGGGDNLRAPDTDSDQASILATFAAVDAGVELSVVAEDGTVVGTVTTVQQASALAFSDAGLVAGQPYTVRAGGEDLASVVAGEYTANQGPGGMGGVPGGVPGAPGGRPTDMPSGMPSGMPTGMPGGRQSVAPSTTQS